MNQLDLFSYPNSPGWKAQETSRRAAMKMKKFDSGIRAMALNQIRQKPMTADEVAEELALPVTSVRPRVSQLAKLGLIVDTGIRKENEAGNPMIVWRIK